MLNRRPLLAVTTEQSAIFHDPDIFMVLHGDPTTLQDTMAHLFAGGSCIDFFCPGRQYVLRVARSRLICVFGIFCRIQPSTPPTAYFCRRVLKSLQSVERRMAVDTHGAEKVLQLLLLSEVDGPRGICGEVTTSVQRQANYHTCW